MFQSNCHVNFEQTFTMSQKRNYKLGVFPSVLEQFNLQNRGKQAKQSIISSDVEVHGSDKHDAEFAN